MWFEQITDKLDETLPLIEGFISCRIEGYFGGWKHWQIWQINIHLPKFLQPKYLV